MPLLSDDSFSLHFDCTFTSFCDQIRLSGPDKIKATSSADSNHGKGSIFARPSKGTGTGTTTLMPRNPSHQRRSSRSRSGLGGHLDAFAIPASGIKTHHEPSATPIIIKPKDFDGPKDIRYRKSEAENLDGWTEAVEPEEDVDVVDLNNAAD